MRERTVYETMDGKRFDKLNAAREHAENRYHAEVSRLSNSMALQVKIADQREWVRTHAKDFAHLLALEADMKLAPDDEGGV